jgi:DNA-3-methyladenine glycosylase II
MPRRRGDARLGRAGDNPLVTMQFTIRPKGPFSLEEAANFGFGQRIDPSWDGAMRLAFCVDGYRDQVGVEVRQDDLGVHCILHGEADAAAVERQVARVLSLDFDGETFLEVGRRDPIIGRLQAAAPGLRPPLFYSPYEAAAWSIISARRPARQMAEVRRQLSEAHGRVFELAGQRVAALPTPEQLLQVPSFAGLTPEKVERLHGVARAAMAGQLDIERIQAIGPDAAMEDLRSIKGIGPFYSSLIVVRGSGFADVMVTEPKAMELAAKLYGLPRMPTDDEFSAMADGWRPFRTWAIVLMRAAGGRVLAAQ